MVESTLPSRPGEIIRYWKYHAVVLRHPPNMSDFDGRLAIELPLCNSSSSEMYLVLPESRSKSYHHNIHKENDYVEARFFYDLGQWSYRTSCSDIIRVRFLQRGTLKGFEDFIWINFVAFYPLPVNISGEIRKEHCIQYCWEMNTEKNWIGELMYARRIILFKCPLKVFPLPEMPNPDQPL